MCPGRPLPASFLDPPDAESIHRSRLRAFIEGTIMWLVLTLVCVSILGAGVGVGLFLAQF
jgi:hypothetical protein